MPRRLPSPLPDDLREPLEVNVPGIWNVYILGIGIALLLAFAGGGVWIVWRLLIARHAG